MTIIINNYYYYIIKNIKLINLFNELKDIAKSKHNIRG